MSEYKTIPINTKAYDKLTWAKRKDETYSDVVIRLVSGKLDGLQRRGEKIIVCQDNRKLAVSIDQSLCMGAESCVSLAPELFAIDLTRINNSPLAMRDVMDKDIPSSKVFDAAETCPYKAITVRDVETEEIIFPK
jgi:ferredoxin